MENQTPKLTAKQILDHWETHAALWLMEDPNFLKTNHFAISDAIQKANQSHLTFLDDMIEAQNHWWSYSVATNPHTTTEMLNKIAHKALTHTTPRYQNGTEQVVQVVNETIVRAIIIHPNANETTIKIFAESTSQIARAAAAESTKATPQTLEQLAQDPNPKVRANTASNPSTTPQTLELLAQDQDQTVKYHVASNPNTPSLSLHNLATDRDAYSLKTAIARNPSTQLLTLKALNKKARGELKRIIKQRLGL